MLSSVPGHLCSAWDGGLFFCSLTRRREGGDLLASFCLLLIPQRCKLRSSEYVIPIVAFTPSRGSCRSCRSKLLALLTALPSRRFYSLPLEFVFTDTPDAQLLRLLLHSLTPYTP